VPVDPIRTIEMIREEDDRYGIDAYLFVLDGVAHTVGKLPEPRHVSGQELLEGIRELARERFGPMTRTVLEHWGVNRCEDFGEIVFNLVDAGLLGKTEDDSREDFAGGYDFAQAFDAFEIEDDEG